MTNNYLLQAAQARARFLSYDQQALIRKLQLQADASYLYLPVLGQPYRISRQSGQMEKQEQGRWLDGNSFEEVMTVLDYVCDSREERCLSGRWRSMAAFGLQFHRNLLEQERNPAAERIESDPEGFCRRCRALGGQAVPGCDLGCAVELFDGLPLALQFWHGDQDFAPRIRYLWDENTGLYLRYESMYFAVNLLLRRLELAESGRSGL